jgi:uncharacterized protein
MSKRAIVHVEIPSKNREESAQFYKDMFDWEFEHMPGDMPYTSFTADNTGGGFPELGDMFKPGDVIIYIASDDLEADLGRIEEKGGKTVLSKQEVPGFGHFAIFTDPTGNRVALWKGTAKE